MNIYQIPIFSYLFTCFSYFQVPCTNKLQQAAHAHDKCAARNSYFHIFHMFHIFSHFCVVAQMKGFHTTRVPYVAPNGAPCQPGPCRLSNRPQHLFFHIYFFMFFYYSDFSHFLSHFGQGHQPRPAACWRLAAGRWPAACS